MDVASGLDGVPGELVVLDRAARPDPRRRVEAERLVHHHLEPRKRALQGHGVGRRGPQDLVLLGHEQLQLGGVPRELVEEERDGRGRRVVPGEHQRDRLIAHLLVRELRAVLVGRLEQEAQDVERLVGRRRPAAADLVEQDLVQDLAGAMHPGPRRARSAKEPVDVVDPVVGERALEVMGGGFASAAVVRVEAQESPHRDPHRQVPRPFVDVHGLARTPSGERGSRLLEHHLDRSGDVLAVERGHHDPPGAVVVSAVDRQQAVAEEGDQVAEARLAPVELLGMLDGDVGVRLRAEHEHGLRVEEAGGEDRPVLALEREQDREGVVRHGARAREAEVARAGRELALGLPLHPDVAGYPADRALRDAPGCGNRRHGADRN